MTPLASALAERIRRDGPLHYRELVDAALYDPDHGFYETGGRAGRRGDFLTSPEVGPLFGAVIARALAAWWDELGRPERYDVVEVGAGPGTLARAVLAAADGPWRDALRYVTVERSAAQRAQHPAEVEAVAVAPPGPITGVVIANELLDNLPFDLVEHRDGAWHEVLVDLDGHGALTERLGDVVFDESLPPAHDGARFPVQHAAVGFVHDALDRLAHGSVVVIDYAATDDELLGRPWDHWVRTYRQHERGGHPLEAPGAQDITCEVALEPLRRATGPSEVCTQQEFLLRHGIEELVAEGRALWHANAGIGDLRALRGRSRVREADALLDPTGLGAFAVVRWVR